jgi:asparagine synthase (glutamine-hydrolysing)
MCGITGLIGSPQAALAAERRPPLAALRHRGPDGEGSWLSDDGRCWLGHTRLAIQDLSAAGAQPMASACGRYVLVFNGEIYNHRALRQQLPPQAWRGHSDSETLLAGLAAHGAAWLNELRGMFAFACYDKQDRRLLLARDRLGIKPLYLRRQGDELAFASELRALALPGQSWRWSPQALSQLLAFGHLPASGELAQCGAATITTLAPGQTLTIDVAGLGAPQRWWQPEMISPAATPADPVAAIRQELERAVAEHLLADVPVGCFLSGGLDSAVVTALACRHGQQRVQSFCVGFPDSPLDERQEARAMAEHCGSDHHELVIGAEQALAWVEQALAAADAPSADGLNTYLVCRAVADQGLKVALSGLGGDELFGGYPSFRRVPPLRALGPLAVGLAPRLAPAKLAGLPAWRRWELTLANRRWTSDAELAAAGLPPLAWPSPPWPAAADGRQAIGWAELLGYTEPMLLRDGDGLSMACGLELRVPLLDHRLVERALALRQRGWQRPKGLLWAATADLLPAAYGRRRKRGFELPLAAWMAGPLRPLCERALERLQAWGGLEPAWVDRRWRRFLAGELHWSRAWVLVVLGQRISGVPGAG